MKGKQMKKLLTSLFVEDKYHAGTILGTILGLMVIIAVNLAIVNLFIWLLHFVVVNPLIVPTKTKWIIAVILTILENIFNRQVIKYHKENFKIFLVDDRTNHCLVFSNICICWSACICILGDNKYCNTHRYDNNCNNCINGDRLLCSGIAYGLIN